CFCSWNLTGDRQYRSLIHLIGLLRFANAQIPFGKQSYLFLCVTAFDHARDEVFVFLLILLGGFGVERDNWQQFFCVRKHFFLDHGAQLFVAAPQRVVAVVVGAG